MRRNALSLVLLIAFAGSAFYADCEHQKARSLAAQLKREELNALTQAAAESPRAPVAPSRGHRVISGIATVVPPISPTDFDSKADVQDLPDIQRVFVPTLLELGLSGAQVAKVRLLMLEARQSARDAKDIAREHRWATADVVTQAIRGAENKYDPQLQAAVGDEHFEQVHTMLADELYFRTVQFAIEPDAELFDVPLSADQKLVLTSAMAAALSQPGQSRAVDPQTGLTSSDQQILARAGGVLSDAQVAMLRRYLARQHLSAAGFAGGGSKVKE